MSKFSWAQSKKQLHIVARWGSLKQNFSNFCFCVNYSVFISVCCDRWEDVSVSKCFWHILLCECVSVIAFRYYIFYSVWHWRLFIHIYLGQMAEFIWNVVSVSRILNKLKLYCLIINSQESFRTCSSKKDGSCFFLRSCLLHNSQLLDQSKLLSHFFFPVHQYNTFIFHLLRSLSNKRLNPNLP